MPENEQHDDVESMSGNRTQHYSILDKKFLM
jgi:hypothetical protein